MSQMKRNTQRNEQTIKIVVDRNECFLELRLYPNSFFYPWLTYGPYDEYDHACAEDDYISKEQFEKDKDKSLKIHKMYNDKKYKELFENKFRENIEAFLRHIEYEVEIEYEEFLARGASIPESPFQIKKGLLDRYFKVNEDVIFKFLKEKGLYFLRNRTILSIIQKWSNEGKNKKLTKFVGTIKEILKIKPGPMPMDLEEEYIVDWYPYFKWQIKMIKDKIKSYGKEIRRDETLGKKLISEYKGKPGARWFKYLEKIIHEEQGKEIKDFVRYLRKTSPEYISKKIFVLMFKVKERKIIEVLKDRKRIAKELEMSLTDLVENFRDIELWGYSL